MVAYPLLARWLRVPECRIAAVSHRLAQSGSTITRSEVGDGNEAPARGHAEQRSPAGDSEFVPEFSSSIENSTTPMSRGQVLNRQFPRDTVPTGTHVCESNCVAVRTVNVNEPVRLVPS